MSDIRISSSELLIAIAKSQQVTNSLAIAVSHLATGNIEGTTDALKEVVALSTEAQRLVAEMATKAGANLHG